MSEQEFGLYDFVSVPWKKHRRDGYVIRIEEDGQLVVQLRFNRMNGYTYSIFLKFPAEQVKLIRKSEPA
jgi:hypothetical protein